ncbi:MAG: glycosyltransferase [Elusimicrobia bacterium]|nr:glycosyltransferase [Elusimicrobiota bacterium]
MQEKNKHLHIITRLDKGGSTENVLLTCIGIQSERQTCSVLYGHTVNPAQGLIDKAQEKGVRFIYLPSLVRSINPVKDIIAFIRIFLFLRKEKPYIVHTHSSKAGILGRWAAFCYNLKIRNPRLVSDESERAKSEIRIKIVHSSHGHVFYGYYGRLKSRLFVLAERITAKFTDMIVALTEGEKEESLALSIGQPDKWVVIHSGISNISSEAGISPPRLAELRRKLGIPGDAVVVGTLARLDPVKGVKYFIESIPLIVSSLTLSLSHSLAFLIVGDGSERKNLEYMVDGLELNDEVIFTGWRNDTSELTSIMDIYVQPSLNEGMGKTIVAASLLGKPVVASRVQGIPDVVINGKTGILVPPEDPEKLASAILTLIKDKPLRKLMGEEGRKWVGGNVDGYPRFSVELMIKKLNHIYRNLLMS